MKWVFLVFLLCFSFSFVSADLLSIGTGGDEIMFGYGNQIDLFFSGIDTTAPSISLISPEQGTQDTDGIVRFIFNPTDRNEITNCSLIYQGGIYTTSTNVINGSNNVIEIVGINSQHPLYSDDLRWSISCTDEYGNIGSSVTRNLDTRDDIIDGGGGGGGGGSVLEKNPIFVNILYSEFWERGENKIKIEAFNREGNLFIPKNIIFETKNEKIKLTDQKIINLTTISTFTLDKTIQKGIYYINMNITDERIIQRDIEFVVAEIKEPIISKDIIIKNMKYGLIGIVILTVFIIILLLIIIDRRKAK